MPNVAINGDDIRMNVSFPYDDVEPLAIDDSIDTDFFCLERHSVSDEGSIVENALQAPIGSAPLCELARNRKRVLIVFDDYSRPTPVFRFIEDVLRELHGAAITDDSITFIAALGTHRAMNDDEMRAKLGNGVVDRYRILNHAWDDPAELEYLGDTAQGAPVWVNKIVRQSDLVIGVGAIMPLEVSGFSGGGKIIVPGLSGAITVDEMHWRRIDVPSSEVLGRCANPVRDSINQLARKAGLDFIVNVVLDPENNIADAVAGDMVGAHEEGCRRAIERFEVTIDRRYDIVIADSFPFDVEFWQANKALDTAGCFVKPGGSIILVTPCHEGLSRTHCDEILAHGYRSIEEIKNLVTAGKLRHKVVGVHMYQVADAVIEKGATFYLVTNGITKQDVETVGFEWAPNPQAAFDRAIVRAGPEPSVAVVSDAPRMIVRRNT